MKNFNYSTQDEIDLIQLELSLENDLDILFETGFNQYGRALCWSNSSQLPSKTQCVIDQSGKVIFQSDSYLTKYEKYEYLNAEDQPSSKKIKKLKQKLKCHDITPFNQGVAVALYRKVYQNPGAPLEIDRTFFIDGFNFINLNGELQFKSNFLKVAGYADGWFPVQFDDRSYHYIDVNEKQLTKRALLELKPFVNGISRDEDGRLIDSNNNRLTNKPMSLEFIESRRIALIKNRNYINFINSQGIRLLEKDINLNLFKGIHEMKESLSKVCNGIITLVTEDLGVQYLNIEGKLLLNKTFDFAEDHKYYNALHFHQFYQGFAAVKTSDGYNFINQKGHFLLRQSKKSVTPFSYGLSLVCDHSGNYSFINRIGEIQFHLEEREIDNVKFLFGRILISPSKSKNILYKSRFVIDLDGNSISKTRPSILSYKTQKDLFSIYCDGPTPTKNFSLDWWGQPLV
ncbi:MAG: hypothetical protein JKY89_00975 [Immundisolibacteraceae bacterium]|nr:hypothetical protein [Immundisolibacteraceae bacterium]